MNFLSLSYALFLPAVFAVHWAVPARFRWATVLAASLWFVAAAAPSVLVPLAAAAALAWAAGLALARRPDSRGAKAFLAFAALAPLAALAVFKYAGFAAELAASAARACGLALHPATAKLALPLGISFWTFTLVSYLLDVRRRDPVPGDGLPAIVVENLRAMRDACAARGVRFRLAFPPVRGDRKPSAAYLARLADQLRDICPEIDGLVADLRVEPPEHFQDDAHLTRERLDEIRAELRAGILEGEERP